jgi:uncharacterized membrane protein
MSQGTFETYKEHITSKHFSSPKELTNVFLLSNYKHSFSLHWNFQSVFLYITFLSLIQANECIQHRNISVI